MKRSVLILLLSLFFLPAGVLPAGAVPMFYDMNVRPDYLGWTISEEYGGSSSVSGGILTINSPSFYDFGIWKYTNPGLWFNDVDNGYGWVVETRMKIVEGAQDGAMTIFINDIATLTAIDIFPDKLTIRYPDYTVYSMDAAHDFHTYRFEAKGGHMDIFVDGVQVMDYTRSFNGGGTELLSFGDGYGGTPSVSQWDYFMFDTRPGSEDGGGGGSTVPEPATLVLLGSGMAGLAGWRRRKESRVS